MRVVGRPNVGSDTDSVGWLERVPRSRIAACQRQGDPCLDGKDQSWSQMWGGRVSPEPAGWKHGLLESRPRTTRRSVAVFRLRGACVCVPGGRREDRLAH
jgi:hypothetical protein